MPHFGHLIAEAIVDVVVVDACVDATVLDIAGGMVVVVVNLLSQV